MSKSAQKNQITTLHDLQPDPNNANKHTVRGLGMTEKSVEECGWGDSLTTDANGVIISGNQRSEIAMEKGMVEPIIVHSDGTRPIVHVRDDLDLSNDPEKRAQRLALLSNRTAQVSIDLDPAVLAELAEDGVRVDDLFSQSEMDALLAAAVEQEAKDSSGLNVLPENAQQSQPGPVLQFGKTKIPLTEAEAKALYAAINKHVADNGSHYGFVASILEI